jgi:Raf kinase inhibitor-like YbhB/YbcL family protein
MWAITRSARKAENSARPSGFSPDQCRLANSRLCLLVVVTSLTWLLAMPAGMWAQKKAGAKLELTTTAFTPGEIIPKPFTCDGANVSPALSWTEPPPGTQSFALIMDDPDAPFGTFVHWVVYNLPPSVRQLAERRLAGAELHDGGFQGKNDFLATGYGGPCPPPGKPHRYFFKLYALDTLLNLQAGARKKDVEQAMKGHVLAEAQLMGLYRR